MFLRARLYALLLMMILATGASQAQEQELIRSQAGRYPLRAFLNAPAAVGPARIVVELGAPTQTSSEPRTRPIRIGSPPDSPYAPPAPPDRSTPPESAFTDLEVSVALDMPAMPASKPVDVTLESTAPGRFEGDALLTMPGTWRLLLLIETPDGVTRKPITLEVGGRGAKDGADGSAREGLELCSPESGENVPITVHCVPDPPRVGSNRLRLEVPGGATLPIMVGVDMPGMNLAMAPVEATRQDDESYEAVVDLPMAGYWQLRVDLNGRALPPFALYVEEPASAGLSRFLLPLFLTGLIPLLAWCALKRRKRLVPIALCASPLLLALGIGVAVEGRTASDHAAGMTMEMMAADMGLGHLAAPLPVLETRVEMAPFVVSRTYPATVVPAEETLVLSPRSGLLAKVVAPGSAVDAGDVLARVGEDVVEAPFRGVVVRALRETGAQLAAGEPIVILTDTSRIALRARAPVSDRAAINAGMEVRAADVDGQASRGKVSRVAAVSKSGTFEFEAVVQGRKFQGAVTGHDGSPLAPAGERDVFFIGQSVALQVEFETLPPSASVPATAVRESADGARSVFVVERIAGQRVARSKPVTLGVIDGDKVQVLSGLESGQTVVASPESSLRDGDVVVPATLGEGVFRSLYVSGKSSH